MDIRDIRVDDYIQIAALNIQLGYDYPTKFIKQRIKKLIENTEDKILVAVDINTKIIGYIHASPYELLYCDSLINILGLVVDKDKRSSGIGRRLIESIEQWAKKANFKGIRLTSGYERIEAHKFYENCGFINRKDQKNFTKIF